MCKRNESWLRNQEKRDLKKRVEGSHSKICLAIPVNEPYGQPATGQTQSSWNDSKNWPGGQEDGWALQGQLSSIPSAYVKKSGVVVTCNPKAKGAETGALT